MEGKDVEGKFIRGNSFHRFVKNWNGGKPPKYETPLKLAKAIGEYLDYEDSLKRPDQYSKAGKGVYTLSGCALHLGFVSTGALHDYEKRDPLYSRVISAFRLFMTDWNEKKLYYMGTFAGSKIWLTNFGGYSEETVVQQNTTIIAKYGGDTVHTTSKPDKDTPSDK